MEDEFQLISKAELNTLKEKAANVEKLKAEQKDNEPVKKDDTLIQDIVKAIQDEGKKERELIIKELTMIKDLNKTTLTNVLDRTDKLDTRIGSLVDTITDLVGSVKDLVEDKTKAGSGIDMNELVEKLKETQMPESSNTGEILNKLEEIETFMNNLKILLGQIKPSDVHYK